MKHYVAAGIALFLIALGGWYLVGALELGVADGTGIAPPWLYALRGAVLMLLFPLGLLALTLAPAIGDFALASFLLFMLVVALNSALLTAAGGLAWRIARRARADRADRSTTPPGGR